MKVGIFVTNDLRPSAGGNFSYAEKLFRTIDTHKFDQRLEICFVGRTNEASRDFKKPFVKLSSLSFQSLFVFLRRTRLIQILSRIFGVNLDRCQVNDMKQLRKNGVDILLITRPYFKEVEGFPFILMSWDTGTRSTSAFPEFLDSFDVREHWYRVELQKSMGLIVESEESKVEFQKYFGMEADKIEVVPLFPGVVADMNVSQAEQSKILKKFDLRHGTYFYYPAQFWAHKNHYNLLLAFKKFRDELPGDTKLIFTGSDTGNLSYVKKVIGDLGLTSHVLYLGFVSQGEVNTLYKNAIALVMPTFLGPTNMPVLEAQWLQIPVICSDIKGHRTMCDDGALYAMPTDVNAWCDAMKNVMVQTFRDDLLAKANVVRSRSPFNIQNAIAQLEQALIKTIAIRKTFR